MRTLYESLLDSDEEITKKSKKWLDSIEIVETFLDFIKILKFDKLTKDPDNLYHMVYTIDSRVLDDNFNKLRLATIKNFKRNNYEVKDVWLNGEVQVKIERGYDFVVQTSAIWSKHVAHLYIQSYFKDELEMLKSIIDKKIER